MRVDLKVKEANVINLRNVEMWKCGNVKMMETG